LGLRGLRFCNDGHDRFLGDGRLRRGGGLGRFLYGRLRFCKFCRFRVFGHGRFLLNSGFDAYSGDNGRRRSRSRRDVVIGYIDDLFLRRRFFGRLDRFGFDDRSRRYRAAGSELGTGGASSATVSGAASTGFSLPEAAEIDSDAPEGMGVDPGAGTGVTEMAVAATAARGFLSGSALAASPSVKREKAIGSAGTVILMRPTVLRARPMEAAASGERDASSPGESRLPATMA
jgi:hypothetical protein